MPSNLELFIADFHRVKNLGFSPSRRSNSTGIGKTFEDLIGVAENNLREADLHGFEIKSQRNLSESYVTLFTKSPTMPKGANTYLRENYGSPDSCYPDIKVLHTSIFCGRFNTHVSGASFSLEIDYTNERLYILVDCNGRIDRSVYYSFEQLRRAIQKIENLAFVRAETQRIDDIEHFHFTQATIFSSFISFENFLLLLDGGVIMYDVRVGAYKTGNKKGKTHDHGSGFRIKRENMARLYGEFNIVE
ncbi:Uncharacterised protein [Moraxella caprae]|uniref:MvaI/BcnI restriction endonuclease domain-containing protein n=1 Tax=Moraxella caprae TaxID=90240 RepID=A0A378R067_9GAMM|nr:MvaI/BcnI family restriction endonuclease [Moraxella caprae]STZ08097.1 Uncharacterised protein [Moraxella caprae]